MQKNLIILTALLATPGCGTIVQLVNPSHKYEAYDGTKYDWQQAQKWGMPILDLPLSFLLDSALLPYVLSQE
ncbi:YceK/YidQ family lipoprotein [Basfia succiniciproducens]|uniref:YceK/YidQ family lipoprotein n=1 Tax=Basfia succiniciproducens TaxID=653940 RepID=UPI003FCC8FFF